MRLGVNTLFMVPGDVGGTETYVRKSLLTAVERFTEVDYVLFTNNENDALFQEMFAGKANVSCDCLNFNAANRPLRIILEQIRLPLAARKYDLDILWSPGYTAPFLSFCPQVVTVCDLQYRRYPEDMSWLARNTLNFLVQGACRRCDKVLAISEFSRQEIVRCKFARKEKVHTVLLGADKAFGHEHSSKEIRSLLAGQMSDDEPYILCVAHTYPHKMVHLLVEGFADVMDQIPHRLILVGKERRGEGAVARAVGQLSDKSRYIRFKNGVPYAALLALFQHADMFVLPSAYEGFGLPVIEAMLAGTPVITTQEASLAEVAGGKAFYMNAVCKNEVARNLLQVYKLSTTKRKEHIAQARAWAETFTWQRSVETMFEVFREIA
ncbi:MAG: hypothetical protein CSA32_03345 [Desulfobulbus propionicus]|nr:MAG: hypothetical protein CSA32_03345 [Desulfobulbus propionicus]